jgi:hypothetical protein
MRKFIFDEFLKKDPDEITFERPDSGSGASDSGEDSDEYQGGGDDEDEFSDEED